MKVDELQLKFMENTIRQLNAATRAYDEGHPYLSDKQWDDLYFHLLKLEKDFGFSLPNSPTQSINYQVVNNLRKVKHNHQMLSLAKTKDWNEFLNYFGHKDVVGMVKLDGLTVSLKYLDGKLVGAETRGDGSEGEDILHNAQVIPSIPKTINYYDELVVDGEIICDQKTFEAEFADKYANPRNFASGSIRLLDAKECESRRLTFIAWNIVKGFEEDNSFMEKLFKISKLNFRTVPWTSSFDWDAKEFLIDKAKKLGYPIDGLVGRFDDLSYGKSLGSTGHHEKSAFAFKFYDETYDTELLDIEWTMGRTGILTPVAVFKDVDTGDSVVNRASLHNVSVMYETMNGGAYVGEPIKIAKMNMIIPQVVWAESTAPNGANMIPIPKVCPICGEAAEIKISDSGVKNLVCSNSACQGKLINRIDHFCGKKGLDIKGLSKATLEKLIDWGWLNTISDLFNLKDYKSDWVKKPGFGEKSVSNILTAIENGKNCELNVFISALGIPLIGSTYAKEIGKREKTWEKFREDVKNHYDFSTWDGFGLEMYSALLNFDYSEADKLSCILNFTNTLTVTNNNQNLKDKVICITGRLTKYKNRAELQAAIENNGGKVVGSVSKNTNYLINNDTESSSSKNLAAKKLGIEIISEEEFSQKFLT